MKFRIIAISQSKIRFAVVLDEVILTLSDVLVKYAIDRELDTVEESSHNTAGYRVRWHTAGAQMAVQPLA